MAVQQVTTQEIDEDIDVGGEGCSLRSLQPTTHRVYKAAMQEVARRRILAKLRGPVRSQALAPDK